MNQIKCNSCKKAITNLKSVVQFMCPKCGKYSIVRCGECRKMAAKYICPECSFEGPH